VAIAIIPFKMHNKTIVSQFTRQAETFSTSSAALAAEPLDQLVALADPRTVEHWLDAACGPGIVCRRLAPLVRAAHGIDLAPAMIEVARREASSHGIGNASFAVMDATATAFATGSFDAGLTRFAMHHIPLPDRLLDELARVVRPGGKIVVADHIADEDADAAAWSQEIERLRDPSHWACLPVSRLRRMGVCAGLELEAERVVELELDFDDWLKRGSADPELHELIEHALASRPSSAESFRVSKRDQGRVLQLRMWIGRWRR
jgi:SAM-dependent methyltransferase